jgi:hypothetical protein
VIKLKELRRLERLKQVLRVDGVESTDGGAASGSLSMNGGAVVVNGSMSTNGGAVVGISTYGGARAYSAYYHVPCFSDLSILPDTLADSLSFLASSSFSDDINTITLDLLEPDILWHHCLSAMSPVHSHRRFYDLSKEPHSYAESRCSLLACCDGL